MNKTFSLELYHRQVHRNTKRRKSLCYKPVMLLKRLFQHPDPHVIDQPRLFKYGDKSIRRNSRVIVTGPSEKGFNSDDPAGITANLRLKFQKQLFSFPGFKKTVRKQGVFRNIAFQSLREENNLLIRVLRFIFCQIGILQKSFCICSIIRIY